MRFPNLFHSFFSLCPPPLLCTSPPFRIATNICSPFPLQASCTVCLSRVTCSERGNQTITRTSPRRKQSKRVSESNFSSLFCSSFVDTKLRSSTNCDDAFVDELDSKTRQFWKKGKGRKERSTTRQGAMRKKRMLQRHYERRYRGREVMTRRERRN